MAGLLFNPLGFFARGAPLTNYDRTLPLKYFSASLCALIWVYVQRWQPYMTNHQTCFKCEQNAKQKHMNMQKQRNLLCFCICFAFFGCFFWGTTSALMRTFTRQQYSLCAPRKKAKKAKPCENKTSNVNIKRKNGKKGDKHCHCFLRLTIILSPCIYSWRAERKSGF